MLINAHCCGSLRTTADFRERTAHTNATAGGDGTDREEEEEDDTEEESIAAGVQVQARPIYVGEALALPLEFDGVEEDVDLSGGMAMKMWL